MVISWLATAALPRKAAHAHVVPRRCPSLADAAVAYSEARSGPRDGLTHLSCSAVMASIFWQPSLTGACAACGGFSPGFCCFCFCCARCKRSRT